MPHGNGQGSLGFLGDLFKVKATMDDQGGRQLKDMIETSQKMQEHQAGMDVLVALVKMSGMPVRTLEVGRRLDHDCAMRLDLYVERPVMRRFLAMITRQLLLHPQDWVRHPDVMAFTHRKALNDLQLTVNMIEQLPPDHGDQVCTDIVKAKDAAPGTW